jgi:hypothetical protein
MVFNLLDDVGMNCDGCMSNSLVLDALSSPRMVLRDVTKSNSPFSKPQLYSMLAS